MPVENLTQTLIDVKGADSIQRHSFSKTNSPKKTFEQSFPKSLILDIELKYL